MTTAQIHFCAVVLTNLSMRYLTLLLSFLCFNAIAQVTVSPEFPTTDEEITIIYDATQGTTGLVGASKVMMHSGVVVSGPDGTGWEFVQGNWGDPGAPGAMTSLGDNKWEIKITPRTYFGVPVESRIYRIGMVFRNAGPCGGFAGNSTPCKEGKSPSNGDIFIDLYDDALQIRIDRPTSFPLFVDPGETLEIEASVSKSADVTVSIDNNIVFDEDNVTTVLYSHVVTVGQNEGKVVIRADDGTETTEKSFDYVIRAVVEEATRPDGIRPGINYTSETSATLCLWAPLKNSVYVIGDFTNWQIDPQFLMKKDGEYFWLEVTGLTPGTEYTFQYLVDESIYIADPFADKVLDPDDQYIPAKAYPDLKQYPSAALRDKWYFNRLAVLQTGQQTFAWTDNEYQKPDKEKLIIYELLIRDYFGDDERNYQNLIDTLNYIKRLGVNAIELMPITEFNGNDSWGYNPTFMFAPDKYYGTKDKLKEFINLCHANGLAVILDVVMNQQDIPNPFVLMYFDFAAGIPSADNPWFNQHATHPFNVFFDMNHESTYTQQYLDSVTHYWINEYHFDGYRFDLSKGFTQKDANGDVNAWGQYDASRINILKRMADKIWSHSPDAYVILEHFADNTEEKELAEYRADEGKGMMLWGNLNGAYTQNVMGNSGADFSSVYHQNRDWQYPHLIGYMESHDEERIIYRTLENGNTSGDYDTRDLNTALQRLKAANLAFLSIPGPKMIWQFGELGYDESINRCPDGTINESCRVAAKPVHWEYHDDVNPRNEVYSYISEILNLRHSHKVFTEGIATFSSGSSLVKQITLKNSPYIPDPEDASEMNVHIVANFDVNARSENITFPHAGIWYEYFTGEVQAFQAGTIALTLLPGDFRLFTDYPLNGPITSIEDEGGSKVIVYPNPVKDKLIIEGGSFKDVKLFASTGRQVNVDSVSDDVLNFEHLAPGVYFLKFYSNKTVCYTKIIKH